MKKKVLWLGVSFLLVAALVLASCAEAVEVGEQEEEEEEEVVTPVGEEEEEEEEEEEVVVPPLGAPIYGGTVTWSYWVFFWMGDMTGWDPMYDWSAMVATEPYLETLMMGDLSRGPRGTNEWSFPNIEYTPEEYVTGRLAESWEVSADRIVYHIRPGVYWTGKSVNPGVGERREFVAEDIKYNADLALVNPYTGWVVDWVDNVEVVDKYTVAFNLSRFKCTWTLHLGYGYGGMEHPVPREVREAGVTDWKNHYGTGPFLMTNYIEGSSITYEKNPDYWGTEIINGKEYQLPFVDKVVCPVLTDWSTKIAALRTGALDLVSRVPLTYRDTLLNTSPALLSRTSSAGSTTFIGYQCNDGTVAVEPFTDRRVRKAMSAAIDRDAIVREIYVEGDVLTWPVNPMVEGVFVPVEELPQDIKEFFVYDPVYARQLLADAGYEGGFSTEIILGAPTAQQEDVFSMVLSYWADIGVDAELIVIEAGAKASLMVTKDYDQMFISGSASCAPLYMENWTNPPGTYNAANYNNPELTAKFHYGQSLVDIEERTPIFKEISLYFLENVPYLTLPSPHLNIYWWPWLKNYYGEVDLSYFGEGVIAARVWLDEDLREDMGY